MDTRDERGLFSMPATDATTYETVERIETEWSKRQVEDEPESEPVDIFARASVLQLQFRRLGTQRKVNKDAIDVKRDGADRDADKDLVSISKRILEAPELKAIEKHDGETARWLDSKKAGPAFANQGGFHLIANSMIGDVTRYLDEREAERADLVDRFLGVLQLRIDETRARLGPLGRDVQYPTRMEAERAFGMSRTFMTFGIADQDAARAWQDEALSECRSVLRTGFADVISHLRDRLTPDTSGKPKVFRDSLVKNFDEFVASFESRNLANDDELADLVKQARRIMAGVDATDLRNRGSLRRTVAAAVADIDKAAAALVINKPTRFYGE